MRAVLYVCPWAAISRRDRCSPWLWLWMGFIEYKVQRDCGYARTGNDVQPPDYLPVVDEVAEGEAVG